MLQISLNGSNGHSRLVITPVSPAFLNRFPSRKRSYVISYVKASMFGVEEDSDEEIEGERSEVIIRRRLFVNEDDKKNDKENDGDEIDYHVPPITDSLHSLCFANADIGAGFSMSKKCQNIIMPDVLGAQICKLRVVQDGQMVSTLSYFRKNCHSTKKRFESGERWNHIFMPKQGILTILLCYPMTIHLPSNSLIGQTVDSKTSLRLRSTMFHGMY